MPLPTPGRVNTDLGDTAHTHVTVRGPNMLVVNGNMRERITVRFKKNPSVRGQFIIKPLPTKHRDAETAGKQATKRLIQSIVHRWIVHVNG